MGDVTGLVERLEARADRLEMLAPYADDVNGEATPRMEAMLADAALDREAIAALKALAQGNEGSDEG